MPELKWIKKGNDYFYFGAAPEHITGIETDTDTINLNETGDTYQLVVTKVPENAVEAINLTYQSNDTSVATVSNSGLVTCVTPGECTITVTDSIGGYSTTCNVAKRLPTAYQEVEWIGSSGSQVIKTGVYITEAGYRADIDFQITSSSASDQAIIGFYNNESGSNSYRCGYGPNDGFTMSKGASSLDRQTATGNTMSFTASSYQIYLFAKQRYTNGNRDSNANGRVYSCQIYGPGDILVRDFIPCYRKSDNVIGLYDLVGETFYTNQGSGTFTKGGDV